MIDLELDELLRLMLRIIAWIMLVGGILIFGVSFLWIIMSHLSLDAIDMNKLLGEIGYRVVVLGTPCIGLSFAGYGLLSRLIGIRLVMFVIGLMILLYYGWIYSSVELAPRLPF